jgi:hypothetical protein
MGNQETRGMHFVPETYLNKFGVFDNKKDCTVFFLDKTEGNEIKATPPSNLCKKRDMYLMEGETVEERQCVEDFYQTIEDKYDYIYKILTDSTIEEFSQEDHETVVLFVITLLFRTKKLMSEFNNFLKESFTKAQSVANQFGQEHFIYGDETISFQNKTINQVIKETDKSHNPTRVATQLKGALNLFQLRKDNEILIIKIVDDNFSYLTSDNPVFSYNIEKGYQHLFDLDSELSLTIDKKHRIIIYPKSFDSLPYFISRKFDSGEEAENETISSNYEQYLNAEKFIFSDEKEIIEEVLSFMGNINQTN